MIPDQPISFTVRMSWPGSSRHNLLGTHASSSTRTRHQDLFGFLQSSHRLLASHAREVVEELFKGVPCFQIINQCMGWHASPNKNWSAAKYFRVTMNYALSGSHKIYPGNRIPLAREQI